MSERSLVLVVDDDPFSRDAMEAVLEDEDCELAFAGDGASALDLARQRPPDLILLDYMMPGMDGPAVLRKLRADEGLAEVPVVMVTALDDRKARLEGLEAGADDFLTKPVDALEFRARVRTVLRLRRFRKLFEDRARFAWVLERSEDGYVFIDETGAIVSANPAARLYLGRETRPAAGPFLSTVDESYLREPREAWRTWPGPAPAGAHRYLVRAETPASRAFWLEVETFRAPLSETVSVVRLRNVTDEVAAQRERRTFQAIVSHKLRTPLNGLIGSLEMLSEDADVPAASQDLVALAAGSARRLFGDIEKVLESVDPAIVSGHPFPVAGLEGLVSGIASELEIQDVSVRPLPSPVASFYLPLSAVRLEAVLRELFGNSKKFHPAHTPAIAVTVSSGGPGALRIDIADDGTHLSPEQLRRALNPFYQGERLFSGQVPGMGLGLFHVASRAWEVGGSVTLANREDGPGVVVSLTLPVRRSAAS